MKMKKTKFILLSVLCSFLAFGMTSCDDDAKDDDYQKEFIQFDNVTLTAGSTQELAKGKDLSWKSDNDLVASIMGSKIIAKRVGTAKMVSSKGSFVVTVKGQYNDFSEPYIQFGHNRETVKYYVKNSDQLIRDEDTLLIYKGNGKIEYTIYHFNDKKLDGSYIATLPENQSEMENWALERYLPMASLDNSFSMTSLNMKTLIRMTSVSIYGKEYRMLGFTQQ